jgi:antitoxin MazE
MQVSRWGNSLAIRLPARIVEALELKEGDDIQVHVVGERDFEVSRKAPLSERLKRLHNEGVLLPKGFVFNREEANARGRDE